MDKYKLQMAVKFKRDVKRCQKRGLPMDELWTVVRTLLRGEPLHPKYKAHILTGDHKGEWECHIQPNWLLVWEQHDEERGTGAGFRICGLLRGSRRGHVCHA